LILRFVGERSRSQLLKIEKKMILFCSAQYLNYKKLSTHMPHAERNKSHEQKKYLFFLSIFRSCDLDLCPTNLNINRLPPLTIRHVCIKQLLKIEKKMILFCSAQYLNYKKLSTHMPHAERNKSHEQLGFRTFGALLIFIESYVFAVKPPTVTTSYHDAGKKCV
jgi:hypothetical protein